MRTLFLPLRLSPESPRRQTPAQQLSSAACILAGSRDADTRPDSSQHSGERIDLRCSEPLHYQTGWGSSAHEGSSPACNATWRAGRMLGVPEILDNSLTHTMSAVAVPLVCVSSRYCVVPSFCRLFKPVLPRRRRPCSCASQPRAAASGHARTHPCCARPYPARTRLDSTSANHGQDGVGRGGWQVRTGSRQIGKAGV